MRAKVDPGDGAAGRPARLWAAALALLFLAALLWRVLYLRRLAASPLGDALVSDAAIYWRWADAIRQGDWLGSHPFFLAPLYPYALALLRGLLGDSLTAVRTVQAVGGAVAAVLLADAARRLSRPAIGIVVGVLVAFSQQAVFFDGLILTESLLFLLESLLLWWVVRGDWTRSRPIAFVLIGTLIGLIAEGRASHALLLVPALALLVPAGATARPMRLLRAVALVGGFALVAAPVALRNLAVGREWIPFTYNLGYNLYVGNHPEADGAFTSITGARAWGGGGAGTESGAALDGRAYLQATEGVSLSPGASSAHWADKARRFAIEHPGRAAALTVRKLGLLWNRREYPQVEFAREFEALAGPLGLPWLGSFACLGMLGLAGLLIAWPLAPRARFVVGYAVMLTLATVPFFVTDRFRHHLLPALAVLAAILLHRLWEVARRPALAPGIGLAAALAVAAVVVNLPAPEASREEAAWRMAAGLGARWLEQDRPDRAAVEFERALALESGQLPGLERRAMAPERTALYSGYAVALARLGRPAEAIEWLERSLAVAPENLEAAYMLAGLYAANGRDAEAESLETRMRSIAGGAGRALASRGWRKVGVGDFASAESLFALATRSSPELHDAWGILIQIRARKGQLALAERTLAEAEAAGMPLVTARVHQALIAALRGDAEAAERALAAVPGSAVEADPSLTELVRFIRERLARRR